MGRRFLTFLFAVSMVMTTSSAASGGGWWSTIDLKGSYVGVGQTLSFETRQVLFQSVEEAELAETQGSFAYVLQGVDQKMLGDAMAQSYEPDWWQLGDAKAIKVGTVSITVSDSNLARASAQIDLTGVEPGDYSLMFCDADCTHALADVIPIRITVLEDPLLARVANSVEDLRWRDRAIKWHLINRIQETGRESADRADVKTLRNQVDELQLLVERVGAEAETKSGRVSGRVSALEKNSGERWLSLVWLLIGAVMGGLIAVLLVRRERRRQLVPDSLDIERELLELR